MCLERSVIRGTDRRDLMARVNIECMNMDVSVFEVMPLILSRLSLMNVPPATYVMIASLMFLLMHRPSDERKDDRSETRSNIIPHYVSNQKKSILSCTFRNFDCATATPTKKEQESLWRFFRRENVNTQRIGTSETTNAVESSTFFFFLKKA